MKHIYIIIIPMLFLTSLTSNAESNSQTNSGSLSATAHLNFVIKIPKILYVRIGPDVLLAPNSTTGNGALFARVVGNSGAVQFSSTSVGSVNESNATNIKLTPNTGTKITNNDAKAVIYTASMP